MRLALHWGRVHGRRRPPLRGHASATCVPVAPQAAPPSLIPWVPIRGTHVAGPLSTQRVCSRHIVSMMTCHKGTWGLQLDWAVQEYPMRGRRQASAIHHGSRCYITGCIETSRGLRVSPILGLQFVPKLLLPALVPSQNALHTDRAGSIAFLIQCYERQPMGFAVHQGGAMGVAAHRSGGQGDRATN